jgi:hypothetical protein
MKKITELQKSVIEKKIRIENNKYIVMLNVMDRNIFPDSKELNYNIYCVNDNFEIIWEIQTGEEIFDNPDPFVYLIINENGEYQASKYFGFEYILDIETGKAKMIGWHK